MVLIHVDRHWIKLVLHVHRDNIVVEVALLLSTTRPEEFAGLECSVLREHPNLCHVPLERFSLKKKRHLDTIALFVLKGLIALYLKRFTP